MSVNIEGRYYILVVRMWPHSLSYFLRKFSKRYEIVVFTILPYEFMMKILQLIPESSAFISQSLCSGELLDNMIDGPVICKDLDLLAGNRKYRFDGKKLLR